MAGRNYSESEHSQHINKAFTLYGYTAVAILQEFRHLIYVFSVKYR